MRATNRPPAPPDLSEEASAIFDDLVDAIDASGLLERADASMLEGAAVLLARARAARRLLDERGLTYESARTGAPTLRPEARIEREALGQFRQYAAALGLSPDARARLRSTTKPPASPWADLGENPRAGSLATFNIENEAPENDDE